LRWHAAVDVSDTLRALKARTFATLALSVSCAVLAAQGACSSKASQHTVVKPCTAGDEEPCTCADMTPSIQTCRADGTGYDPCACGAGGTGGASNGGGGGKSSGGASSKGGSTSGGEAGEAPGGTAGEAGSGGASGVRMDGTLGAPCAMTTDCVELQCIQTLNRVDGTLTVSGGICSLPCTSNSECPAGTVCNSTGAAFPGFCTESCAYGPESLDDFSQDKCHGRADFGCSPFTTAGVVQPTCLPLCSDDDCPMPLFCDLGTGYCAQNGLPGGLPTGASCPLGSANDPCTGLCVAVSTSMGDVGICRDLCILGDPDGCSHVDPNAAACLEGLGSPAGVGDGALCSQLCNCLADCMQTGLPCVALDEPIRGKSGYCGVLTPGLLPTVCP